MTAAAQSGPATIFDVLVALHVASAVIGFGSVAISGVYGGMARRLGSGEGGRAGPVEEVARYFRSRGWPELLILAVPVFGAAALGFRPDGSDFGAFWVDAGFVIWLVAAGLLLAVVRPAEDRIRAARAGDTAAAGRALMWAAAGCNVLFVVALALMVTQPV